jgi:hypothetical protein
MCNPAESGGKPNVANPGTKKDDAGKSNGWHNKPAHLGGCAVIQPSYIRFAEHAGPPHNK